MRDLTTRSRVLLLVPVLTALVIVIIELTTGADAKRCERYCAASVMPTISAAKWKALWWRAAFR